MFGFKYTAVIKVYHSSFYFPVMLNSSSPSYAGQEENR